MCLREFSRHLSELSKVWVFLGLSGEVLPLLGRGGADRRFEWSYLDGYPPPVEQDGPW